jgi:four helix bundle protein
MPIQSYRDLDVWKRSMDLAVKVYQVTSEFPKSELYGLTGQMRRAAVSVPSNIAEGHNRRGREFPHFISIALGSLAELETQALIAQRIGLLPEASYAQLYSECDAIGKMLRVLEQRLRTPSS